MTDMDFDNGVLDLVEQLSFNKGSIVKYVACSGSKDPRTEVQDLEEAAMLLAREIKRAKVRHLKARQEPEPEPAEIPELGNPIPRCEALHLGNASEQCVWDVGHDWGQHQSAEGAKWRTSICGRLRPSKLGLVDAVCELEAGHTTWHKAHGTTWPWGDETTSSQCRGEHSFGGKVVDCQRTAPHLGAHRSASGEVWYS